MDDRSKISTGWLNVNTECNNRCAWCYRTEDILVNPQRMEFRTATQLVSFFVDLGVYSLIFIGGEPTLFPDLDKLILMARLGGIKELTVVTNGRALVNKGLVDTYQDAGLDVFSVSIHSASAVIHDKSARTQSWTETVRGIKNVISAGGRCSLNVIAGKQNVDDIPTSLPKMLEWGVENIIVSCAIPYLYKEKFIGKNALNPRRFAQLIEDCSPISEKIVFLHELPLCLIKKDTFLSLAEQNRLGYGCHIGVGRGLSVDVDGSVIPCNSFPHFPLLSLIENGSLRYSIKDFNSLWETNEIFLTLRNEANVFRSEICSRCDLWSLCNCGCPLTWGYFNPEEYISEELIGINADEVASWAVKKYNP